MSPEPTEPVSERSDRQSREIGAPPARVFGAIRDPASLARWWGPAGFTSIFHAFDFREGGTWRYTMHGPDGASYPNESRFARIEPESLVVIEHLSGHHFVLEIHLDPIDGGTRVHWLQIFDTAEHFLEIADIVRAANGQNLDRLAEVVSGSA